MAFRLRYVFIICTMLHDDGTKHSRALWYQCMAPLQSEMLCRSLGHGLTVLRVIEWVHGMTVLWGME
jgi:hypothetical protein